MDEINQWGNYPSATRTSLKGREDILLRAKIVCAVYDFYCCAKGGIDLSNTTRDAAFTQQHPLPATETEVRRILMDAPTCIAERVGEYVLFAPCSMFTEATEGDTPIYSPNAEQADELQEAWKRFCRIIGLTRCEKKTFYTADTFERQDSPYQSFFFYPTHAKQEFGGNAKECGWEAFLTQNLAAAGEGDEGEGERNAIMRTITPGDIVCCYNYWKKLYGIGVALSSHQYHPYACLVDCKNGHSFHYQNYVDVAWLIGNVNNQICKEEDLDIPKGTGDGWAAQGALNHKNYIPNNFYQYILNLPPTMKQSPLVTDELTDLLIDCHNLVLTGPPGTGKTYLARKIAEAMGADSEKRGFVQFHPSYDYTDFVEGLRPTPPNADGNIGFKLEDGEFKKFCKKALKDQDHNYVFIIDEINRGELSRIFGELFFVLDPDYRVKKDQKPEIPITTQYQNLIPKSDDFHESKGGFYVPENVYIIGTMNDIDRSVESMDFAIRRRFTWCAVSADSTRDAILQTKIPEQWEEARDRMISLNRAISKTEGLGEAYHVGAAYYGKLKGDNFKELWEHHLQGLLFEYLRGRNNADELLGKLKDAYELKESNDSPDGQRHL